MFLHLFLKLKIIDFIESVKRAADIAGIEIREENSEKHEGSIEKIRRINSYAMKFYNSYLKSDAGRAGRNYIGKQGS